MKSILFVLLLANSVFFLWEKYVRPGMDAIPEHEESGRQLERIVLLKELPPVPQLRLDEPPATAPETRNAAAQASSGAAQPPKAAEPLALPQAPAVPPTRPSLAETAKPAVPAESPLPSPMPKAKPPMAETPPAVAAPAAPAKPVQLQCRRIGPLSSEADALALRQRLLSTAGKASVEHQSGKQEVGYWVLQPPAANLPAARANQSLLQQKGAADTLILKDGDYPLAVSVGFFKERARAEKLLAEVRAKGMPLEIRPRLALHEEYWLRLQAESSATVDAQWKTWRSEHPGSPAGNYACP